MAENQVIIGTFGDEASADAAAGSLKAWDKASEEVKLTAVGVLVLDENGQVKERKLGARSTKKGAGIGLVLAVIAPPTLLAGIAGGGLIGHFHHSGLGLSTEDRERLIADLTGGKAAVGVLAAGAEADAIAGKLTELGGDVEAHPVTDEALQAVAAAAPIEPEAAASAV